ncbi:MAG: IS1 family transposase [Colwellia sp.]|nr:IS1 family transposase [Colwellia sp.]
MITRDCLFFTRLPWHHPLYGTSGNGKYEAALVCKTCKTKKADGEVIQSSYVLKSNKAVVEEYERLSRYLATEQPACPNKDCPTYTVEFIEPSFKKRGLTTAGSQRYECKHCKKSFVVGEQTRKQRRPEINIRLFDLLIMHVPLRKIIKHLNISPKTLYDKIDFIHKQCLKFVAEREQQLIDGKLKEKSLYLATDRQVQITNWTKREDKRNTELYGIGTACLTSGYVFAFNFNFDERLSQNDVELVASEYGDNEKPKHHREMARVWLDNEFADATAHKKKLPDKPPYTLQEEVAQKIEDELSAIDMTSSEDFDGTTKLPAKGVLVHNEYTMMGHFLLLKKLTQRIEKTRFYLDQDTGIKTAYLSIFRDEIQAGKSDGFLVRAVKNRLCCS